MGLPTIIPAKRLVAAARELRDRWLERVHEDRLLSATAGKYDVSRSVAGTPGRAAALLTAPAGATPVAPVLVAA